MADDIKKFSITIEPAFVGIGKEKRLETVMFVRILNGKNYDEFQAIVPPKSRLDQELKKILTLSKQKEDKKK